LRASAAVHDHRETPSAIPLKPASAIAEIRIVRVLHGARDVTEIAEEGGF